MVDGVGDLVYSISTGLLFDVHMQLSKAVSDGVDSKD